MFNIINVHCSTQWGSKGQIYRAGGQPEIKSEMLKNMAMVCFKNNN